jgi:hypothetical protein
MTYYTILFITALSGPLDGHVSDVLYPSMADCMASIVAVSDTLAYDHGLSCEATDTPSGSIRPKRNPFWGQGNDDADRD